MSIEDEKKPIRGRFSALKYECSFAGCDLQFKRKDRLDAHEFTHSQVKKFACTVENCTKAYSNSSHLQRHKRNTHGINKGEGDGDVSQSKETSIVPCTHEYCAKLFDTEARMLLHYSLIHSEDVELRKFECDVCGEKFRRKTHLQQHKIAEHTENYRYTCDKCGKGFFQMSRLNRHVKSHEIRQCTNCDATFDKWSALMAHKHKEHVNSNLKCTVCDREFNSKRLLKAHQKTHVSLGDRTVHQCPFDGCAKFFLQRNNMLAHYKSQHENKKFACTFDGCTLQLSTKQKLDHHIKAIHSANKQSKQAKKVKGARAERKDKGVQKISTASKFFNFSLPPAFERAIITGHGKDIHISYNDERDDDGDAEGDIDSKCEEFNINNALATVSFSSQGVVEC